MRSPKSSTPTTSRPRAAIPACDQPRRSLNVDARFLPASPRARFSVDRIATGSAGVEQQEGAHDREVLERVIELVVVLRSLDRPEFMAEEQSNRGKSAQGERDPPGLESDQDHEAGRDFED